MTIDDRMEFLIVGGILGLGYQLSRQTGSDCSSTSNCTMTPTRHVTSSSSSSGTGHHRIESVRRDFERRASAKFMQAQRPIESNVIGPGYLMPYFTDERRQATSDELKDRKLELFNGSMEVKQGMNKSEVERMFDPSETKTAVPVTSGGSATAPEMRDDTIQQLEETWVSKMKQHVHPTPSMLVGPGLGLADPNATTPGFHPLVRVLPTDLAKYTKTSLGAVGANHGVPIISTAADSSIAPNTVSYKERVWENEQHRPLERSIGALSAPTIRAQIPRTTNTKMPPVAGRVGGGQMSTMSTTHRFHQSHHGRRNFEQFIPHEQYTNRTATDISEAPGMYVIDKGYTDNTKRSAATMWMGGVKAPEALMRNRTHLLSDTSRKVLVREHVGNPGMIVNGVDPRKNQYIRSTIREALHSTTPMMHEIVGGPVSGLGQRFDNVDRRNIKMLRGKKLCDSLGTPFRPAGRVNVINSVHAGKVAIRDDTSHAVAGNDSARFVNNMAPVGRFGSGFNKLQEENPQEMLLTRNDMVPNILEALPAS
jgi:hypothetical protein